MSVGALEHKMGIHAQPTCVMNYDGATGWLVGEPGRGLNAMFTMMNAERLMVGVQGLGIAEAANQKAVAYARERLQGNAPDGTRGPVPIIAHPDVRKMLLTGRAFIEAARALAVWTALQMDIAARHPDADTRREADALVALLTPVVKAAFTDFGFETAVASQQVFGGHGYIREWGMEQYVRDARIAQIYEGTNGVQAMDLVTRKLGLDDGRLVSAASSPSSGPTSLPREPLAGAALVIAGRGCAGAARGRDRASGRCRAARCRCRRHRLSAPVRPRRLRLDVGAHGRGLGRRSARRRRPSNAGRPSSPGSTWSACCHRRWRFPALLPLTPAQ